MLRRSLPNEPRPLTDTASDIASIGALITVLSLAFDPFMQQVVLYRLRSVPRNTAAIGRSQGWYPNPNDILDSDYISLNLKAAFYNGLFNEDAAPQLTPICATGNCTWLPMSTLAFCSKCEDVTSPSPVKCNLTSTVGAYDYGSTEGSCDVDIPGVPSFNYSGSSNTADSSSTMMQFLSIGTLGQNGHDSIGGIKGPYGGFTRVSFAAINNPEVTNVTTCVMFPCVRTYNLSVIEGNLVSAEISRWYNESGINYNALENVTLSPPTHEGGNTTTGTPFVVEASNSQQIANLLYNSFNGHVEEDSINGRNFSSDYIQAAYAAKDLGQLMSNVADSLTNYIRNSSSVPYRGTVWGVETYVHVRWIWLILPIALAPTSLLFLLSAIWASSHRNIKVWKSSSLATVFHGLERPIKTQDLNRQSDMDKLSKEIRVKLQQTNDKTHNLMLSGSKSTQLDREDLSQTAAGDELEHTVPPYPSTGRHESRGDGTGRQMIPRRPVGLNVSPGKTQSRSTPLGVTRGESLSPG